MCDAIGELFQFVLMLPFKFVYWIVTFFIGDVGGLNQRNMLICFVVVLMLLYMNKKLTRVSV